MQKEPSWLARCVGEQSRLSPFMVMGGPSWGVGGAGGECLGTDCIHCTSIQSTVGMWASLILDSFNKHALRPQLVPGAVLRRLEFLLKELIAMW